jgi:hypothetical protein
MTPEQKWLLLFGSGWVNWSEVADKDYKLLFNDMPRGSLEINPERNQVRLKQYESIRVHVAPSAGVHTI